jgi:hypothetical protein
MEEVFKVFCIPKQIENRLITGDKFGSKKIRN